jgi:hypothetical protein
MPENRVRRVLLPNLLLIIFNKGQPAGARLFSTTMENTDTDVHFTIVLSNGPVRPDGSLGQDGAIGADGLSGQPGVNSKEDDTGQPGKPGTETGIFKKKCTCATDGTGGAHGKTGGNDGGDGGDGTSPPSLTLRVGTFDIPENSYLYIQGRGGNGGNGGDGGNGGNGDFGGKAGLNVDNCIEKGTCQPALGGNGGDGAPGGKGGKGGNAGNGGNILIYYGNPKCIDQIVPFYEGGAPGNPGKPGDGGTGGKGGQNETFPRNSKPTFASDGATGHQTGDGGGGSTAKPGTYSASKIPPSSN